MNSTGQHIVVTSFEAWGHVRPICAFIARVALCSNAHITFLIPRRACDRANSELSRAFGPQDAQRLKQIRIVGLNNVIEGATNHTQAFKEEQQRYMEVFEVAYAQLFNEKSVTCAATQVQFPALPAPKVVVFDLMVGQLLTGIRKVSSDRVKAIGFCTGMLAFTFLTFAPPARGGRADLKTKALAEATKTGRPAIEVADEIAHDYTDEVIQIPGFPKMYHWEFNPQDTNFVTKGVLGAVWMSLYDVYETCDGMIIASPEAYEPQAIQAARDWFADTKRPTWALGPLAPSATSLEAAAGEEAQSESFGAIKKFMDDTLATRGMSSMLYISFGSLFWPSQPEKLEAFLEVVLEKKIPFILSYGSPFAKLTDGLKEKVELSGLGLLSRWSPQQTILAHAALGWFVTHAGHNSTVEAVGSGVPMICWPFHADQPVNSVNLTDNHDVAYELLEVRTGNGLKQIHRSGRVPAATSDSIKAETRAVLEKAFGEDGARKRANVKKLQQEIESAWSNGGSADKDLRQFLTLL